MTDTMKALQGDRLERPKLGIICGSGPEAGIDLWQKLLATARAWMGANFRGDLDAPYIEIISEPMLGYSMDLHTHGANVRETLLRAARDLAPRVDVYAIACNTLNVYAPDIIALELPAQLITPMQVLQDFIEANGLKRAGLLAAAPVLALDDLSAYQALPRLIDLELPLDGAALQQLIFDVKRLGAAHPQVITSWRQLLAGMQAQTLFLACTELPLIPVPEQTHRLVDVTQLLADALAKAYLAV